MFIIEIMINLHVGKLGEDSQTANSTLERIGADHEKTDGPALGWKFIDERKKICYH